MHFAPNTFRIWSAVCPVQFRDADLFQQEYKYKNKRMVLFMKYENRIKFYEEQIEALLYNIEEKEKSYIYEQVRIIKQKIEELKSR